MPRKHVLATPLSRPSIDGTSKNFTEVVLSYVSVRKGFDVTGITADTKDVMEIQYQLVADDGTVGEQRTALFNMDEVAASVRAQVKNVFNSVLNKLVGDSLIPAGSAADNDD